MSDDSMDDFVVASDSGSDFEAPTKTKKTKAPAKTTATKAKAPAKPKAAPKKTAKTILSSKDTNTEFDISVDADTTMDVDEDDDATPAPRPIIAADDKSASEKYQKLSQLEHVLKRPDTYIGSVETTSQQLWVFDSENKRMVEKTISYVPGLFKIFDEILVNAADHKQNDANMDTIKVKIDRENSIIQVYNNGKGIPIEIHSKEKVHIPELIFGHLLTSSNYDDDQRKVTGGRNGYGAKLTNIYSTEFTVETADRASKKCYKQVFKKNMSEIGKPKITENKKDDEFTRISFKPDFSRFHMEALDDDVIALMKKRVYDIAATVRDCKVYLNDERLKIRTFKQYVDMYANAAAERAAQSADPLAGASVTGSPGGAVTTNKPAIFYERFNDRWEVAYALSDGSFQQVSFVNSIATTKGGTHVEYITKQVIEGIAETIKKKNKAGAAVKPNQIRNHVWIFINCLIENPSFDSQTKEYMTLAQSKFGSKCKIPEEFIKKVLKSGIVENILNWARNKHDADLKKHDGKKQTRLIGITKLEDANMAGSRQAGKCTLILTEGDSAKALAISGLSVVGRDLYGVFPLRGKLLNVRDASAKSLTDNVEINNIKQILGLKHGKVYTDVNELRYGHLMIMTDQDHDGSHIKGLLINFLDHFFPSLLRLPGFLIEFITPIVRVTKGNKDIPFFTMPEYEKWLEETPGSNTWVGKYYKGLGTSTAADAKRYFKDMNLHRLKFKPADDNDRALVDMAFNKKKADDRKEWLRGFITGTYLDHTVKEIQIADFVNKELVLFSMADNMRSIPSAIDGFKPGQRKILFGCIKRKLKKEIKVAQLAGYVSEHAAYHHGEQSLVQTIVGLAQDFVGSNNMNILSPNGQFGTRAQGGKDAASARYIFTNMMQITRQIFHPADDGLLTYLSDDGTPIEPETYMPVIPMVLVNGSEGIGTGWSSSVPNYNPKDIMENLRRKMNGEDMVPMMPWFRGYAGTIERIAPDRFKCTGTAAIISEDTIEVTELPIRLWTQTYKEQVESWIQGTEKSPALVKNYREYHTDTTAHFQLVMTQHGMKLVEQEGLEKALKLSSTISTSNMVLFNAQAKLRKYSTPEEILDDFYDVRYTYYQKRKEYLVQELSLQYERLSNQARFVLMIANEEYILAKKGVTKRKAQHVAELRRLEFRPFPKVVKAKVAGNIDQAGEDEEENEEDGASSDFDYLLNMPLQSMTEERAQRLYNMRDEKEKELEMLLGRTPKDLWSEDLECIIQAWDSILVGDSEVRRKNLATSKQAGKGKGSTKNADDDDYKPSMSKPRVKKETGTQKKLTASTTSQPDEKMTLPKATATASSGESQRKMVQSTLMSSLAKSSTDSTPVIKEDEDDDDLQVFEPSGSSKITAKGRKRKSDEGTSAAPPAKKKATAAPRQKKAAASKVKEESSDENDDSILFTSTKTKKKPEASATTSRKGSATTSAAASVQNTPSPPAKREAAPRRAAATKKSKYVIESDSEEDEAFINDEDDENDDEGFSAEDDDE